MNTPSITLAQVLAFAVWGLSQAVAFGWITDAQDQALLSGGATAVALGLKFSDAIIRHGRSKLGVELAAEAYQQSLLPRASQPQAGPHA